MCKRKFGFVLATIALSVILGLVLASMDTAPAASIGPNPVVGTLATSQQGYTPGGSGGFAFKSSGGTQSFYLSSGGSVATSVACNELVLTFAGTGVISTNGATSGTGGLSLSTAGTSTFTSPLTLNVSNLNTLTVVGTGQLGYYYGN